MALTAQALTTVDAVLSEPGVRFVKDTAYIERLIEEASSEFQVKCGRKLYWREDLIEYVAGYGTRDLEPLEAHPIVDVSEIIWIYSESAVEPTSYRVMTDDIGASRIVMIQGVWRWTAGVINAPTYDPVAGTEAESYKVTYSGGFVTPNQAALTADDPTPLVRSLPFAIERAVLDRVVQLVMQRGRDKAVTNKTSPAGSQTWGDYPSGYMQTVKDWTIYRA